jgi:hypothetical protein
MWSTNEMLLQSYRSIFVSTQSILLAVGALTLDRRVLFAATALVGLVMIWLIWFPVVRARHLVVDFYKHDIDSRVPDCTEHEYIDNASKRAAANAAVGLAKNWRETRIKMDALLPAMFSVVWLVELGVSIWD